MDFNYHRVSLYNCSAVYHRSEQCYKLCENSVLSTTQVGTSTRSKKTLATLQGKVAVVNFQSIQTCGRIFLNRNCSLVSGDVQLMCDGEAAYLPTNLRGVSTASAYNKNFALQRNRRLPTRLLYRRVAYNYPDVGSEMS